MAKHVAVLMGGWSAEREVSLRSGKACADALIRRGYRVSPVDVGRDVAAVLARHPAVVLADDFRREAGAISELRDAGIDVISTLDVTDLDGAVGVVSAARAPSTAATPASVKAAATAPRANTNLIPDLLTKMAS